MQCLRCRIHAEIPDGELVITYMHQILISSDLLRDGIVYDMYVHNTDVIRTAHALICLFKCNLSDGGD